MTATTDDPLAELVVLVERDGPLVATWAVRESRRRVRGLKDRVRELELAAERRADYESEQRERNE